MFPTSVFSLLALLLRVAKLVETMVMLDSGRGREEELWDITQSWTDRGGGTGLRSLLSLTAET